jgi:hypothetical protein
MRKSSQPPTILFASKISLVFFSFNHPGMKNNKYKIAFLLIAICTFTNSLAQQPPYTPKLFRTTDASGLVKIDTPANGIGRTFIISDVTFFDSR